MVTSGQWQLRDFMKDCLIVALWQQAPSLQLQTLDRGLGIQCIRRLLLVTLIVFSLVTDRRRGADALSLAPVVPVPSPALQP